MPPGQMSWQLRVLFAFDWYKDSIFEQRGKEISKFSRHKYGVDLLFQNAETFIHLLRNKLLFY